MDHPNWYPAWRHEAFHQMQAANKRLETTFRLGKWERWDYDLDAGTLTFSDKGKPKVVAAIQIVGTTSERAGTWLWAWGNDFPESSLIDSLRARAFGEEHGICELTHETIPSAELNALGWELTAVMLRVSGAIGAYRPPRPESEGGGALFVTYKSVNWASGVRRSWW